jgi:outer membrane protein TolC
MTTPFGRTRFVRWIPLAAALLAAATPASAQTRLSLDDALKMAADHSPALAGARAGEAHADADRTRADSQRLPQVNFTGGYDRTLASEFSAVLDTTGPACAPLDVNATQPLADRVAELERAASCGAIGPSFSFGNLPFGQKNVYRLTVGFQQAVYAGGRITAQRTQADLSKQSASLVSQATRASVALDVTQAFYDAALSDRLLAIAQMGYDQASASFDQTKQAYDAGRQPEFELLRAQVARDNQRPLVIRRKADRDLAYFRLCQLLGVPQTTTFSLDVDLDAEALAAPAPFASSLAEVRAAQTIARATVRQAETVVSSREAGVTIAKSERLPAVNLESQYGKVGYPSDGAFPGTSDFRTNWTLGASVNVPIFTGFRLKADEVAAIADLDAARAQLRQAHDLADLDAASALNDLAAAEASWNATAGAVTQAQRAYEIADLRYREGISTQLELSDSRLSLQVAQANRAQAARDLQVARAHVALLPDLPVGGR